MQTNRDIAREVQHKFDFYFLALVFTVLAFTIQTAKCSEVYQLLFEIPSWICFAVSGLFGLGRLEWRPTIYRIGDNLCKNTETLNQVVNAPSIQHNQPDLVNELKACIAQNNKDQRKCVRKDNVKYMFHKWLFIIGILFLIVSRSWQQFTEAN